MNFKKIMIFFSIGACLFFAGCGFLERQGGDITWGEGGNTKGSLRVKQFKIFDKFEVSKEISEASGLALHFKSKNYTDFSITGLDVPFNEEADLSLYFESGYGYEVEHGSALLIPFVVQIGSRDSSYYNYLYDLEAKNGKFLDKVCVYPQAEVIKGTVVASSVGWVDEYWPGTVDGASAARLSEKKYCDLSKYLSGTISEYSYLSQQLSHKQDEKDIQQLEEKILRAYYDLLLNREFDRLYQVSLFKGEIKQENPFKEWYAGMWSGAVVSIAPKGDHTYDVVSELEYCRKINVDEQRYFYTSYDCEEPEVKKYRATKKIVIGQDSVRVDGVSSQEITPKWFCDKEVFKKSLNASDICRLGDSGYAECEESYRDKYLQPSGFHLKHVAYPFYYETNPKGFEGLQVSQDPRCALDPEYDHYEGEFGCPHIPHVKLGGYPVSLSQEQYDNLVYDESSKKIYVSLESNPLHGGQEAPVYNDIKNKKLSIVLKECRLVEEG